MDTDVIIKANSHGIRILLNADVPLEQLLEEVKEKWLGQKTFLKKEGKIPVSFEGRILNDDERSRILFELNHLPETEVEFIYDVSEKPSYDLCDQIDIPPHKAKYKKQEQLNPEKKLKDDSASVKKKSCHKGKNKITENYNEAANSDVLFFNGCIGNGQTLEVKKSIIIMGDVEKKATVISGGNIIILGHLKGRVSAGKDLQQNRFVLALTMEPVHINIGTVTLKEQFREKFNTNDAVIAYCENNQLIFKPLSLTSL